MFIVKMRTMKRFLFMISMLALGVACTPPPSPPMVGCDRVPSAIVEDIWGEPITATNALVESAAGNNCIYTVGTDGDSLVFNYIQAETEADAVDAYTFQVEGLGTVEPIEGLGDAAVWSTDLNMLEMRDGTEVMQARYLDGGSPRGQQANLIALFNALRE